MGKPTNKQRFYQNAFLYFLIFSQNHARNSGVWLIYKCSLYTSFYGILLTCMAVRFSESIFESEEHTYEMEYEQPKDDGKHVKVGDINNTEA